jgi:hypothetical protein
MSDYRCPFCAGSGDRSLTCDQYFFYRCKSCGDFVVTNHLDSDLAHVSQGEECAWLTSDRKFQLGCVLKERVLKGFPRVGIYTETSPDLLDQLPKDLKTLEWRTLEQLLQCFPDRNELFDRALLNLDALCTDPFDDIEIPFPGDSHLLFCRKDNLSKQIRYMEDLGYLTVLEDTNTRFLLTIPPSGWERIEYLNRTNVESKKAFVAMWFNQETNDLWEKGMQPGIKEAKFEPVRVDNTEHNNKICDEIIASIRRSRFVVADFTAGKCKMCDNCVHQDGDEKCVEQVRPRGGVYYEAGFAQGLGIPVIWTVRANQIDQVHFDTRQYNHIVYETPEQLSERLSARIRATIA